MQTNFGLINIARFAQVAAPAAAPRAPQTTGTAAPKDLVALRLSRAELFELREALKHLGELLGVSQAASTGSALRVLSSSRLTLDTTTTPTVLESLEEINTAATSFSPFGPNWTGSSTALLTIGGVYDGSNGSGTLSFESRSNGVHGQDRLRIRVRDPGGSVLQNFTVRQDDPLDQQYAIGNGLYVTLGAGSLSNNDTTTINVFDTIGSAVDPTNPFDGVRNSNPNLDAGQSVSFGSFSLNGETLNVAAGDSVQSILSLINQSAAGVTASFDAARERVVLTQTTFGSAATIDLQSDDSGLLDALKLSTAVAVPGLDPDVDEPLANVAQFQDVQSGTLKVNDVDIAIDIQTDSLTDVLGRINALQTEATASYNPDPQYVAFDPTSNELDIRLDEGTTGFLTALNIASRSYEAPRGQGLSEQRRTQLAQATQTVSDRLNNLLGAGQPNQVRQQVASQLGSALQAFFGASERLIDTGVGIRFRASSSTLELNAREFSLALKLRSSSVRSVLLGDPHSGTPGLFSALQASVDHAIQGLDALIGSDHVDIYA